MLIFWGWYLRDNSGRVKVRSTAIVIELTKVGRMTPSLVRLIMGFSLGT